MTIAAVGIQHNATVTIMVPMALGTANRLVVAIGILIRHSNRLMQAQINKAKNAMMEILISEMAKRTMTASQMHAGLIAA